MRSSPVVLTILFWTHSLFAGQLYWTTGFGMTVETANTDGTGYHTLLNAGTVSLGIAVDPVGGQLYWSGVQGRTIRRANLDGTGTQTLFGPAGDPYCMACDSAGKTLYWTEGSRTRKIMSCGFDGSNVKTVLTLSQGYAGGIAVDNQNGYLYWANVDMTGLYRARLDGTELTQIAPTGVSPIAVSLDLQNNKIYWTENGGGNHRVRRANLDGSGTEDLVLGLGNPLGLALDLQHNKMYWTDNLYGYIQSANLDGTHVETLVSGLISPTSLALVVPEPATLLMVLGGCMVVLRRKNAH